MKKIGVSIYPEKSSFAADKEYLDKAKSYGFVRVFTSLLQISGDADSVLANFKKTVQYASSIGMEVMVDINPKLFEQLGVSYDDLSFFHELGAYGVRLDMGFGGLPEKVMTYNQYGLKIEVNMSGVQNYIDSVMGYDPNTENLLGSHNFYPRRYTGLSQEVFDYGCERFKAYNLHTAAFVTSQVGELGPWGLQSGLPTLEAHRNLSLAAQVNYYRITNAVDDIIIGNAYASDEELQAMSEAWFGVLPTLAVTMHSGASTLEREIVLENIQTYRGDMSEYLLRSSMSRIKYKDESIAPNNTVADIRRGDVLIDNDQNQQYKGELFIALADMENDGGTNVVGRLTDESLYLLDFIPPFGTFMLSED